MHLEPGARTSGHEGRDKDDFSDTYLCTGREGEQRCWQTAVENVALSIPLSIRLDMCPVKFNVRSGSRFGGDGLPDWDAR